MFVRIAMPMMETNADDGNKRRRWKQTPTMETNADDANKCRRWKQMPTMETNAYDRNTIEKFENFPAVPDIVKIFRISRDKIEMLCD